MGRSTPRKALLLKTAYELFNQQGYCATGIDQILKASGVSKATLYKHFKSKNELILAVLKLRHENILVQLSDARSVMDFFSHYEFWFHAPQFFGCNYINACAEFTSPQHVVHDYAKTHKAEVFRLLYDCICHEFPRLSKTKKKQLARQIQLLLEGATVTAQVNNDPGSIQTAREIAQQLIKNTL